MRRFGLLAAVLVIVLDQLAKAAMLDLLVEREVVTVTPFLNLVLVWNTGVSFGLLANDAALTRWLLIGVSLIVSAALAVWLWRAGDRRVAVALGLIIGGALGNVIDRLLHRAVVDFLDFHLAGWHWPAFNLADGAITLGVAGLVLVTLLERPRRTTLDGP